jgi:hypothetical protein
MGGNREHNKVIQKKHRLPQLVGGVFLFCTYLKLAYLYG